MTVRRAPRLTSPLWAPNTVLPSYCSYSKATLQPSYDRSVTDEVLRKRLFYQSHKRGMKENDLLLGTFANRVLEQLSREELEGYDLLLQQPDPDVYNWITGKMELPPELRGSFMDKLLAHVNKDPCGNLRGT
eukprot:CAMPEP_0177628262 /NCGR_PEP_ID=MMETSP0447-20121125/38_1 /TAXON_ID=0 /ORGANISM="Stygamoeba regulata, Strain BSH-02190019" /LENGTH=131 /DNA_ID=CAMNT_0019129499 /DNA_START=148 /DNA_END=543 /DNA_ORIENTATION=+